MHEHQHDENGRPSPAARTPDQSAASLGWASVLGNAAVARLAADSVGGGPLDEAVARAIEEARGAGTALGGGPREKLERAMGEDFSDVRIHADERGDTLSRAVQAKAFTTGSDVFFRAGAYEPETSAGETLLAHELTHVVQQRGAPPATRLAVTDPGDASEREAEAVASKVAQAGAGEVARQAAEEEEEESVQMQEEEEEESVQMQAAEEEEEPLQA